MTKTKILVYIDVYHTITQIYSLLSHEIVLDEASKDLLCNKIRV